jgi:hypothetical protein
MLATNHAATRKTIRIIILRSTIWHISNILYFTTFIQRNYPDIGLTRKLKHGWPQDNQLGLHIRYFNFETLAILY